MATMEQETKRDGMAQGPDTEQKVDRKKGLVSATLEGGGGGGDVMIPPDPKSGLGPATTD